MKKTIINLEGNITKVNKEEFTTQEYEQVVQGIHDHLKEKGCLFDGGSDHISAETHERLNK